jgi:flagellar assembly factor FliW
MTLVLHSTRFGSIEIAPHRVIELDGGLVGIGGTRYALLAPSENAPFLWLHSLEDGALALPVTNPARFFPEFRLELLPQDAARLGPGADGTCEVYVTVCASPDISEVVANLRAPIVIRARRGAQVINQAPGMALRAPLFPGALAVSAAA